MLSINNYDYVDTLLIKSEYGVTVRHKLPKTFTVTIYISTCGHSSGDSVLSAEKEIQKGVCKEFSVNVYVYIR